MISLLPADYKKTVLYARRNKVLLHWVWLGLFVLLMTGGLLLLGNLYIKQSVKSYATQAEASRERLKAQKLEETKSQVEGVSNNLKLVIQVLSKEILFSKLIKQIGAVMPENTVLTGMEISKVEGGINLKALASDYTSATQVQINLQDSENKVFEKVDIENVQCSSVVAGDNNSANAAIIAKRYPCQISLRALFSKNSPYLFINNDSKAGL